MRMCQQQDAVDGRRKTGDGEGRIENYELRSRKVGGFDYEHEYEHEHGRKAVLSL